MLECSKLTYPVLNLSDFAFAKRLQSRLPTADHHFTTISSDMTSITLIS